MFLTNLILNIINEDDKIYIFSPSLHQDFYQKLSKCFSNYIPIHVIPNFLNEDDFGIVIDEIINNKGYEKLDIEIETYESVEDLKYPQVNENNSIIILDDLSEKEMNNPQVQTMFKRSRYKQLSVFITSQDYYDFPKKTIRANGNIYHIRTK